jgi:Ribosomal protein L24e
VFISPLFVQPVVLITSKCKSLLMQRKKPAKLTWTQGWRRLNKKIKVEEITRRRSVHICCHIADLASFTNKKHDSMHDIMRTAIALTFGTHFISTFQCCL